MARVLAKTYGASASEDIWRECWARLSLDHDTFRSLPALALAPRPRPSPMSSSSPGPFPSPVHLLALRTSTICLSSASIRLEM